MLVIKKFISTGKEHINNNISCQDYCDFYQDDSLTIGLLSDGAGSAKYAKESAEIVIQHGLDYLINSSKSNLFRKRYENNNLQSYIKEVVFSCQHKLQKLCKKRKEKLNNFNCTFLGFLIYKKQTVLFQIGDGVIIYRNNLGSYKCAFDRDFNETSYHNETSFLVSSPQELKVLTLKEPQNPAFLFLTSDGLEKVCARENKPYEAFLDRLEQLYFQDSFSNEFQNFLDADPKLNSIVYDDKSAIITLEERD